MSLPVSVSLERIKCYEQEDSEPPIIDTEDDEPYVIVLAVNGEGRELVPRSGIRLPESSVTRIGPISGFDTDDLKPVRANLVWGLNHSPMEMAPVERAFLLVALLENDSADPAAVENRVVAFAQAALSGLRLESEATNEPDPAVRFERFIQLARQAFDGVLSLARVAIDPDDQIGPSQMLRFDAGEYAAVQSGAQATIERSLRFQGDDADYRLDFALRLFDVQTKRQPDWRSCRKCQGLFYGPFAGVCPVGEAHDAGGSFNYEVLFDCTPGRQVQADWRSCRKCQGLFYGPFRGRCPAGDIHDPGGSFAYTVMFGLARGPGVQNDWRACSKCQGLFYGPFRGRCPDGGEHDPTGSFDYGIQFRE